MTAKDIPSIMAFKLIVFLTILALRGNSASPPKRQFQIYYEDGENTTLHFSEPHLSRTKVVEICNIGVWLSYTGTYYQFGNFESASSEQVTIHPNIGGVCEAPGDAYGRVWSARPVGGALDNTTSFLSFLTVDSLQDEMQSTGYGLFDISFAIKSFITINTTVEFFKEPNYHGESFCFQMDPEYCQEGVCWVWSVYLFNEQFPWHISLAKSVRLGCNATTVYTPAGILAENYPRSMELKK